MTDTAPRPQAKRIAAVGASVAVVVGLAFTVGSSSSPAPHKPHRVYLADAPGAADPRVTQDNIATTICVKGYTATVRPKASVTNTIKRHMMKSHGYTDSPAHYELDHEISLEIGGAPVDLDNLWLERQPHAKAVDQIENRLHRDVCAGRITLSAAQAQIVALKHRSG